MAAGNHHQMTRIVTTNYRYKCPPRKRKAVEIEGPAIVTAKSSRRPVLGETAAELMTVHAPTPERVVVQPSTPHVAARVPATPPANDDRKPAIVTTTSRKRAKLLRARYVSLLVWCRGGCQHQAEADLQALIDQGKGDVPLIRLKFRCSNCGSDRTDSVVTGKGATAVQPW